ncbi:MAG: hypothetical protein EBR74_09510 [Flavobacteriia bacterium]|nr:hypothetical protein [Flavobacteriia bacterium]
MKFFSLVILVITSGYCFSQAEWTKDDRSNLFSEFTAKLGVYKTLSSEQKESIALCGLDALTAKYAKKDFNSKIDIEIERIYESTISQCAKNIGVVLDAKPKEQVDTPEKVEVKEWDRESKEKLAKDFARKIDEYSFLSEADKELLSICYINFTVSNLSKPAYDAMIDIEMKQFVSSTCAKCAKSNNISLEKPVTKTQTEVFTISKKNIIGTWKTDQNFTIIFNDNGTYLKTFKDRTYSIRYFSIEGNTANGEWFLDEKGVITLNESWTEIEYKLIGERRYKLNETAKYRFNSVTADYFKMELTEGTTCCSGNMIQANKVE